MIPYQQIPTTSVFYSILVKTVVNFVVKTTVDMPIEPAVRAVFKEAASNYALDNFRTMREIVDEHNYNQRLGLYLTGAFAGLAVTVTSPAPSPVRLCFIAPAHRYLKASPSLKWSKFP